MEKKIKVIINAINYIFLTIIILIIAISNIKNYIVILISYFLILSNLIYRNYGIGSYENESNINEKKLILSYCIDILLISFIWIYDIKTIVILLLLLLIEDIALNFNTSKASILSLIIYFINGILLFLNRNIDISTTLTIMLILVPIYIVVFIVSYLIKYLLIQNTIIEKNLNDIILKKLEKDSLYDELKEAYCKIESSTALKERNRMAAEIHDTIGHTLTTVLVELEASKRLMSKDLDKSKEKLSLAQGEVRKGLNSIRRSVRLIENGDDILEFYDSIEAIISNVEIHSEITIKRNLRKDIELDINKKNIIISVLMEGITNGIRHGGANQFIVSLYKEDKQIIFQINDNGKGTSVIMPGFGMRVMKNRVKENNGIIYFSSEKDKGFEIKIIF